MKLFQKLLIAPVAIGLITPLSATANEFKLEDMAGYSSAKSKAFYSSPKVKSISEFNSTQDLAITNSSVDNLNVSLNNFEAGSFSETTTMSGAAAFQVGGVDNGNVTQALTNTYSYSMDLNSSFTGDDNLYIGIETGNASGVNFVTDGSVSGSSDTLSVASIFYQFPYKGLDIAVGPKLDNDDLMPTTTSAYSDKFFMAGYALLESNAYLYGYKGAGVAVSKNFDNGFNTSGSIIGTGAATSAGILTEEGMDIITLSAGYDGENFGGGIVYVDGDDYCGIVNSFISNGCSNVLGVSSLAINSIGIGGYWTPNEGKTTISATANILKPDVRGINIDDITDYQIAVEQQVFDGVLSASWKTIPLYKVVSSTDWNKDTLGSYLEVYYTQSVNDSLDLTYGITMADPDTESGDSFELYDYTAIGAQATFKF